MTIERKGNILHVEDDAVLARTVTSALVQAGYHVETARTAEEGLRRLKKVRPDLVILDISMPGMGGVTFLRQISGPDGKPRIPTLVLTAFEARITDAIKERVDGFLLKPVSFPDLTAEVDRILHADAASD